MSWSTAISDLRTLLNDNPLNRYCYRKKVFGKLDGVNVNFKTFEFRRVTDFTTAELPLAVYLNGSPIDVSKIENDNTVTGEFALVDAPIDGDELTATYY